MRWSAGPLRLPCHRHHLSSWSHLPSNCSITYDITQTIRRTTLGGSRELLNYDIIPLPGSCCEAAVLVRVLLGRPGARGEGESSHNVVLALRNYSWRRTRSHVLLSNASPQVLYLGESFPPPSLPPPYELLLQARQGTLPTKLGKNVGSFTICVVSRKCMQIFNRMADKEGICPATARIQHFS